MEKQMEHQRSEGEEQKEPSFRSILLYMEMALADYQRLRQERWEKEKEEAIFGLQMSQARQGGKMEDPKAKKKRKKKRGTKREEKEAIKEREVKRENKRNRKMDYYNSRKQQKCDTQQREKIRRGELEVWGIGGAGTDKNKRREGDINLKRQKRSKRNARNNSFYRDNG